MSKLNRNESTVVEQYHESWKDKKENSEWKNKKEWPTMTEVHLGVVWYAIDDQPNWHPSFNANRINRNGVVGDSKKVELKWYDNVWQKYVGQKMPRFDSFDVCRPNTIYDCPNDLIEVLKTYSNDPRVKKFVCGTGKFYIESHNKHRGRKEEIYTDPNPDQEEISNMTMLFETNKEAEDWVKEVFSKIKGFTPEQIAKNKALEIVEDYSDEEEPEESPVLVKLKNYIFKIVNHIDFFAAEENKSALCWAMWRFGNIFYSARELGKGYDDSILYFLESFNWAEKTTEKQAEKIFAASSIDMKLSEYGYINPHYNRGSYICDQKEIERFQNSDLPEVAMLISKPKKTFQDHEKIMKILYGDMDSEMLLTYYGGYKFIDGFLEATKTLKEDPCFAHGYKQIPEHILNELTQILNDTEIVDCQNMAKAEFEKDRIFYFKKTWFEKKLPKEAKEKMEEFTLDQWVKFETDYIKLATEKEFKKNNKKEDYKLILGIDPQIQYITKNSHPSYIEAAINICQKTLKSKTSSEKDKSFVGDILSKLS